MSETLSPNVGKVVTFTNISDKDFTHAYGGVPFTVRAGESMNFPFDVGTHLARHLSRRILIAQDKGATSWDGKDVTANNGNGSVIWTSENEESVMQKILGETYEVERPVKLSEAEELRREVAKLNKEFEGFRKNIEAKEDTVVSTEGFERKDLFAKCKELGVATTPKDTNADLVKKIEEAAK
jgi:hypothetical protein